MQISYSPMFPSIEIFFPLRVKLSSRFVMSARQRFLFGGVAIFIRISLLGVLMDSYLSGLCAKTVEFQREVSQI